MKMMYSCPRCGKIYIIEAPENKYEYGYMCTLCKGYSLKSLGVSLDEWKKVDPIIEDKVSLMNDFENRDYAEKEKKLRDYDGIRIIREYKGFFDDM